MDYTSWLQSAAGIEFINCEVEALAKLLPSLYGYHAVMLGDPCFSKCLQSSKIAQQSYLATNEDQASAELATVVSRYDKLALSSDTIDLIYFAHCLEFAGNQHEILRETYRVLRPDGHLVLTMYKPFSILGIWHQISWKTNFVSLLRLQDWLALLGFDIIQANHFKMAYVVVANKRVLPLTPIKPVWVAAEDLLADELERPTT